MKHSHKHKRDQGGLVLYPSLAAGSVGTLHSLPCAP